MSISVDILKESYLEDLLKEHRTFIDLSSLKNNNFQKLAYKLQPILIRNKKKLVVLKSILNRLNEEALDFSKKYPYKPNDFENNLKVLNVLHKRNIIEFKTQSSKVIGKYELISRFFELRSKYKLLLITEDDDLAKDILNLNNFTATTAFKITVKKISKLGYLEDLNESQIQVLKEEKFKFATNIHNIKNYQLTTKYMPTEGNTVVCSGKIIKLLELLAEGGEGSIYSTDTEYVCKIYKKEKLDTIKFEKIKLMLSKKIFYDGICWPIDLAYNVHNEFVGYLMPKAYGKELQKCLFYKKLLIKNFPDWRRRDTIQLCITILEKIQFLHDRNIILGDINPLNMLVVNPKKVYFVDTDSYQIEGFPCPVGTINYTAPEIQGKNFAEFLRTFGNEYFAISTLLFMIMMGGKPPYSKKGGESQQDNIIKMDFSYPLGENSNGKAPDGKWVFMWSHMPYYLKESFYNTFKKDCKNSLEQNRFSTREWRKKMEEYLELLVSGKLMSQDSMADELFPDRYKKVKNKKI